MAKVEKEVPSGVDLAEKDVPSGADLAEVTPEVKDEGLAAAEKERNISIRELFRFADSTDKILMFVGGIMGAAHGMALPMFSIILGSLFTDFQQASGDPEKIKQFGNDYAALFGFVGIGVLFAAGVQVAFFIISSERQTLRIRKRYLDAILRQEIAWFDASKSGELSSKIAENTVIIREALGDKLGALFQFGAMFLGGFIIGFIKNWKLTLVILAGAPLLAIGGFVMMKVMSESVSGSLTAYSTAGGVAEEAFNMIRTVASFNIESRVTNRYRKCLTEAEQFGLKKAKAQGVGMGFTFGCYFMMYALAFWYGSVIVIDSENAAAVAYPPPTNGIPVYNVSYTNALCQVGQIISTTDAAALQCVNNNYDQTYTFATNADVCRCMACNCGCYVQSPADANPNCTDGGEIIMVFFAVVMGAFALGQASPSISALNNGKAAAAKIYSMIERNPLIDADAPGKTLDNVKAHIKFENVAFRYPSRPEAQIFSKLNLEIKAGESVALVGGSGCGKSTVIQIAQRFYDPEAGLVTVDGVDIRELSLKWWRNCIGVVGQEPVLFATSIAQNIAYGAPEGVKVTPEQIEQAAKAANAFNFIKDLPEGFETFVGERGSSLSGGQKQRIAIARAIIRDPTLLILDEATSALDNESERIVQAALDDLLKQKKRTTITIAHRLSTIRNADKIVVLGQGGVLEQGNHDELMELKGHYNALIAAAQRSQEEGKGDVDVTDLIDNDEEMAARMGSSQQMSSHMSSSHVSARKSKSQIKTDVEEAEDQQMPDSSRKLSKLEGADVEQGKSCCGKKKTAAKEKEELYTVPISRVFEFSKPEKYMYIPAVLAAALNGSVMPLFAILFSNISNVYFYPTTQLIEDNASEFSLYFVYLGLAVGLCYYLQFLFFGIIAEKMTTRVRSALFHSLLRQEIGFYDQKRNSVGSLTAKLATDAALVKASVADRLSLTVMNIVTLVAGLVIAFVYGWELTLVLIALLPLIILGASLQMLIMAGLAKQDDKSISEAGQVLSESISGIRTVTAFGLRKNVVALYDSFLEGPSKAAARRGVVAGAGFGFSQGVIFAIYAVAFLYGSRLIADSNYTFQDVINVFFAVVMAGFGMGQSAAMAPDVAKASLSVSNVFRILDRETKCDPTNTAGAKDEAVKNSDIEFHGVDFTYPSRPDAKILKSFSLNIKAGTTVALCGSSGSGKSTGISLLERFYDADCGDVIFHGINTKDANISWLRSKFGFVQQEPQLFGTTIFENIAYGVAPKPGSDGSDALVTEEQVIEAAKSANAHDFIMSFPDGYQTMVGEKGSQLSGGQKQRICLARAIIRNPEVLLLDEATSALDNESERIVQETLDKLMADSKRTTIVIAHRLSTIQNADLIAVVDHGCLIEQGTHDELLAKNGAYAKLYQSQDKGH